MAWLSLPVELRLAVVHILPPDAVRAFSAVDAATRALCLPAIFSHVHLPSAAALLAFVRHVPPAYGTYVRSLAISTRGASRPITDPILALLGACPRLHELSLALADPVDPERLVPAFARLAHVHTLDVSSAATENVAPVSERLVVALAASLPSLADLRLSRITRSAVHVDPCDVPFGVPVVTNDVDVPAHPILGTDLSLPHLLRLGLSSLAIRDTWLGCDSKIEIDRAVSLQNLVLTGSMYGDTQSESHACTAWLRACPQLRSFDLGTSLVPPPSSPEQPLALSRLSHVHLNATRVPVDDFASTMDVLKSCQVESLSIACEQEGPVDDFARECAMDDLSDWRAAVDDFLAARDKDAWKGLARVTVSFAPDVRAAWDV